MADVETDRLLKSEMPVLDNSDEDESEELPDMHVICVSVPDITIFK